jgi:hypothetical protein
MSMMMLRCRIQWHDVTAQVVRARRERQLDCAVDRKGENQPARVIRVFSDQIHATR